MEYTFAVQWPMPYASGWQVSKRRFDSWEQAAQAMAEYLAVAADNGTFLEAKLMEAPGD